MLQTFLQSLFFFLFLAALLDYRAQRTHPDLKGPLSFGVAMGSIALGLQAVVLSSGGRPDILLFVYGLVFYPLWIFMFVTLLTAMCAAEQDRLVYGSRTRLQVFPLCAWCASRFRRTGAGTEKALGTMCSDGQVRPDEPGAARIPWRGALETAAWSVAALGFGYAWLWFCAERFGARPSPRVAALARDAKSILPLVLPAVLIAPPLEELAFRGYLLGRLRGRLEFWLGGFASGRAWSAALAILITSILWALPHVNVTVPEWVKWGQIFGIGLMLGLARLRLGLEACVLIHLAVNIGGFFLAPGAYRAAP